MCTIQYVDFMFTYAGSLVLCMTGTEGNRGKAAAGPPPRSLFKLQGSSVLAISGGMWNQGCWYVVFVAITMWLTRSKPRSVPTPRQKVRVRGRSLICHEETRRNNGGRARDGSLSPRLSPLYSCEVWVLLGDRVQVQGGNALLSWTVTVPIVCVRWLHLVEPQPRGERSAHPPTTPSPSEYHKILI